MMNMIVERTRMKYRKAREQACYSIMDIEFALKAMAWNGFIWCLQNMEDLSEGEEILINHYLNKYQSIQIYDC